MAMRRRKFHTGDRADGSYFRDSQTEAQFQEAVTGYATMMGWVWHHETDSRKSKKGLPDFIAVRDGRMVVAEFKRPKDGVYSQEQLQWIAELQQIERNITAAMCFNLDALFPDNAPHKRPNDTFRIFRWEPSDWPEIEEVLR